MADECSSTSVLDALRQIVEFLRARPSRLGVAKSPTAGALMSISGMSEDAALLFSGSVPPVSKWIRRSLTGVDRVATVFSQSVGRRGTLVGIVAFFVTDA